MRIRRLELLGFKSFPDRTVLEFDRGVSCVVGPNGCGKSNVVDALKWCLGEQSARSLRGDQMLDVIFAGSTERAPVGYAEVGLVFSADEGEPFPGDYAQHAEVEVTRRLHRSGASEYRINQVRVRRKDVVALFLDTGVGNDLYSFIEQGRIGKIVHAKPLERRSLIDEAAGIASYKVRRDEAQARLDATAVQLDRAADVAEELGERLRSLGRQALRAVRYRRLRAGIRQREIALGLVRFADLSADRRALRRSLREARGELATVERERARRDGDVALRRAELATVEEAVTTWRDEVAEIDATLRALDGERGFAGRRDAELRERLTQTRGEIDRAVADRTRLAEQRGAAETRASELQGLADAADVELRLALRVLEERQAERDQAAASHALADRERIAFELRLGELERRRLDLSARRTELEEERSRIDARLVDVDSAEAGVGASAHERVGRRSALDAAVTTSRQAVEIASQRLREALESEEELAAAEVEARREQRAAQADGRARMEACQASLRAATASREEARDRAFTAVEAATRAAREAAARQEADRAATRAEEVTAARRRAAAWLEAWDADAARQADARRVDDERARRTIREQAAARLQAARTRARQAQGLALEQARVGHERALALVDDHLASLRAQAEQLIDQVAVEKAEASAHRERIAALRARADALAQADAQGDAAAVRDVLPGAPRLLDLLPPEVLADDAAVAALAPWVELTVVRTVAEIDALVAAGCVGRVLWLDDDDPSRWRGGSPVSDVFEAVAGARARGRPMPVRGDLVVEPGGVVHFGGTGGARQAVARLRERQTIDGDLAAAVPVLARLQAAVARSSELAQAASAHLHAVRDRADQARRAVHNHLAQVERTSARRASLAIERLDAEVQRDVECAEDEIDERVHAAVAAHRVARQVLLDGAEAAVTELAARLDAAAVLVARESEQAVLEAVEQARSRQRAAVARAEAERLSIAEEEQRVRAEVDARADVLRSRAADAMAALADARSAVDRARSDLAATERVRDTRQRDLALLDVEDHTSAERLAALQEERRRRTSDRARVAAAIEEVGASLEELERDPASQSTRREQVEAQLARTSAGVTLQRERLARAEGLVEQARGEANRVEVERASVGAALEASRSRDVDLAERIAAARTRLEGLEADLQQVADDAQRVEIGRGSAVETRAEAWDRLERERGRSTELRQALADADAALRALADRRDAVSSGLVDLERRVERVQGEVDDLKGRIDERYQVSLPGLLDRLDADREIVLEVDPELTQPAEIAGRSVPAVQALRLVPSHIGDEDQVRRWIAELEGLRRDLGPDAQVDLGAVEEYTEVAARHADLERQRGDLEESVQRIRSAIAKMNRTCRQRFRDTFDRVNDHFQRLYPQLVGGGSARLGLTDEDDLLATGVDVFVQPPGKRLQTLALLSGGEKAMAAIAVILALFQVKPSPFCVLDEVDAPLDEANGARFNQVIREMSRLSQFILITHNRKTMEAADTLYGITMPQPGCSRVVSVQLEGEGSVVRRDEVR